MICKFNKDGDMEEVGRRPKWKKGDPTAVDKTVNSVTATDDMSREAIKRDAEQFRKVTDLSAILAKYK